VEIQRVTVIGGQGRDGRPEPLPRLDLEMGQVLSIVGPTGSGKTALINDIALLANRNTPSGRRVLVNDAVPPESFVDDPASNPIALITQHTTFLSDLPVHRFLTTHARVRGAARPADVVAETIEFANQLTGEPIILDAAMTELSGGQTRALLVADAVVIGNAPIVLLDEIENAGIDRARTRAAAPLPEDVRLRHARSAHRPRLQRAGRDAPRRDAGLHRHEHRGVPARRAAQGARYRAARPARAHSLGRAARRGRAVARPRDFA
jgi:ABC-type lipoprotein export system ATPase subunit